MYHDLLIAYSDVSLPYLIMLSLRHDLYLFIFLSPNEHRGDWLCLGDRKYEKRFAERKLHHQPVEGFIVHQGRRCAIAFQVKELAGAKAWHIWRSTMYLVFLPYRVQSGELREWYGRHGDESCHHILYYYTKEFKVDILGIGELLKYFK